MPAHFKNYCLKIVLSVLLLLVAACDETDQQNSWNSNSLQVIEGVYPSSQFGYEVALTGDLDGDGFADLAVAAPQSPLGGENAGAVYIFRGNGAGLETAPTTIIIGGKGDRLGISLFAPGDLNGDGLADLLVGSLGNSLSAKAERGAAFIFLGSSRALKTDDNSNYRQSLSAEVVIEEIAGEFSGINSNGFGARVAAVGDLNGDGATDIAIGAAGSRVNGLNQAGAVFIFYNNIQLAYPSRLNCWQAGTILRGNQEAGQFGYSLAPAGDVDSPYDPADSTQQEFGNDLLVGAPGQQQAFLFFGGVKRLAGKTGAANADLSFSPITDQPRFASDLAGVGDQNNDNIDDIIISSPEYNQGLLYLYFGKTQTGPLAIDRLLISGEADGDLFGQRLGVNVRRGNLLRNYALIGAPASDFQGQDSGSVYLLNAADVINRDLSGLGQLSAANIDKIIRNPRGYSTSAEQFGAIIKGGSDFNADGAGDFVVGAPGADYAGEDSGAIFLYY